LFQKLKKPPVGGFIVTQFLFSESADNPDDQGDDQQDEENTDAHTGFKNAFYQFTARK
jgi:hypothetical protein